MEAYLREREELIAQDRAKRTDQTVALTEQVQRADQIVRRIRAYEESKFWQGEWDGPNGGHLFPGMGFLTAKDVIVSTKLFKIVSMLPKGALLHAHLDATVNAQVLLKLSLQHPAMHICVRGNVLEENLPPEFRPLPPDQYNSSPSLTDPTYQPGTWVNLRAARDSFAGGPEDFDRWVTKALTIDPGEAYGTHNTTNKIWEKFASVFLISKNLIRYYPVWSEYIRAFLLSSVEDGISYVEPRVNFWYKYMYDKDGEEIVPHSKWLAEYDRVQNEVKVELSRQGRGDKFVGSRIIYSTLRFITPEELEWYTEDCISLKQQFPHLIAGFDLVGHEDTLKPLIGYIEPLQKFVKRQKELGIEIPFFFHAGETLGDGTAADMNLYDAILLGTKRIGHGFSLIKHPRIMEICKEREIAIEVCPISNEVLRLTSSMPMHPLPALINHGIPVALSSDDPAIFGNMGLSFDFFQVLVASEVTGLVTIGVLARDSIKYSALEGEDKRQALALWEEQWNQFIEWVIQEEHGELQIPEVNGVVG